MAGPRATLDELSGALLAAGVGVYLHDGKEGQTRWVLGGDDGPGRRIDAVAATPPPSLPSVAEAEDHRVFRLLDGPDGTPRFLGVVRAADPMRGARAEDDPLDHRDGRSGLQAHLTHLAETLKPGARAAICALGVDGMREFCRIYGYAAGDTLLRDVGRHLVATLPDGGVLGRVGGSKFVAVLVARDAAAARGAATALAGAARGHAFDVGFGPLSVSLSAGGVIAAPGALTNPDLFDAALAALDQARGDGEGNLRLSEDDLDGAALSPAAMRAGAHAVMRALDEGRVTIAFQPVVMAAEPERVAFRECLARVRDKNGRLVSAAMFLPRIERLDLIRALDRRVLAQALEALLAHPTERLSINVSARTISDRQWLGALREAAAERPDVAERLIVELTESMAVVDVAGTKAFLDEIRELGVAIALDDFGAGYTSFRHLRDFRPDWVKIDGGFVTGLATDPDNKLFVDTLVSIARNFDMATVAEFVENEADAEALRALGVDCLQGYHYGRPEIAPRWPEAAAV